MGLTIFGGSWLLLFVVCCSLLELFEVVFELLALLFDALGLLLLGVDALLGIGQFILQLLLHLPFEVLLGLVQPFNFTLWFFFCFLFCFCFFCFFVFLF